MNKSTDKTKYRPSSANRWTVCTISPDYVEYLTERGQIAEQQETSPEASLGSLLHSYLNKFLESGELPPYVPERPNFSKELQRLKGYLTGDSFPTRLHLETSVDYKHEGQVLFGGTFDVAGMSPDGETLHVIDYKSGFIFVPAKNNPQLMCYAVAIVQHFDLLRHYPKLSKISLSIFQPMNGEEKEFLSSLITLEELKAFELNLVKAITTNNKRFESGDHCKYCPASTVCKAGLPLDSLENLYNLNTLTDLERFNLVRNKKRLEAIIKDTEATIVEHLKQGEDITPYQAKLITQRRASWQDEQQAQQQLIKLLGDKAYERKTITPTTARKLLSEQSDELEDLIAYKVINVLKFK